MKNKFLVVMDSEGNFLPMAGIWRDNEGGQFSAEKYQQKNPDIEIVKVKLLKLAE